MPQSQSDSFVEEVTEFLEDHIPTRNLQIYPNGDKIGRRGSTSKQLDNVSNTTRTSNRIDNYSYGMNLARNQGTVLPHLQPNSPAVPIFTGGAFESPSGNEAEAQTESDIELEEEEAMCEEIHKAMRFTKPKPTSSNQWLPFGDLHSFSQRSRVNAVLRQHFSGRELSSLADYVCGVDRTECKGGETSQRIFVILVLMCKVKRLPAFMKDGLRDRDLPFEWLNPASLENLISPKSQFGDNPLPCFKKGGTRLSREFYEKQWKILAPIIDLDEKREVTTFHLAEEVVMPWTSIGEERREGTFSMVQKVEIHRDHHSFHDHKAFALKTLLAAEPDQAENEFEKELKAFTKMVPGNHILDLCATFKIGSKYSFLFPWAEGGNLRHFWNTCPTQLQQGKISPAALLRWVAKQCYALAEALQSIHEVRVKALRKAKRISEDQETDSDIYGIHGDIKPENILLFNQLGDPLDIGVLKIADFGLTEFHRLTSRTRPLTQGPNDRRPAPTYDAPELVQLGEVYSRKADVWALGCVFSEFLTWVVHGTLAVTEYNSARAKERDWDGEQKKAKWMEDKFFLAKYYRSTVKTSLKKSVKSWLAQLYHESKTEKANFVTDFVDLLRYKVLECDRKKRISCEDLVEELAKLASRASEDDTDEGYWGPPLPSFRQVASGSTRRVAFSNQSSDSSGSWIHVPA